jgi:hypothetical protein
MNNSNSQPKALPLLIRDLQEAITPYRNGPGIRRILFSLLKSKLVWVVAIIGISLRITGYFIDDMWQRALLSAPFNISYFFLFYGFPVFAIIVWLGFIGKKIGPIHRSIVKIYAGFIIVLVACWWVIPSNPEKLAMSYVKEGQPIVDAIYSYKKDSTRFPSCLSELLPGYISVLPDTSKYSGWRYGVYQRDDRQPQSAFALRKYYPYPHTVVRYKDDDLMQGWYISCEGDDKLLCTPHKK